MRKSIFLLLAAISWFNLSAQLSGTRWRATIKGDNPRNVIFDFKSKTLTINMVSDSALVESMAYTSDGKTLTVVKLEGQSDCDNTVPGKYGFRINKDSLFLTLVSDACTDRSDAIGNIKLIRFRDHHAVKVDPAVMKKLAGTYALNEQRQVNILFDGGKLYIESASAGLPKLALMPLSDNKYFLQIAGVELEFVQDKQGKTIQMISHEEKDQILKKIK